MKSYSLKQSLSMFVILALSFAFGSSQAVAENVPGVAYRTVTIEDVDIFYREAGNPNNPTILLLHGFPTSSHMFRDLIPELADQYHLVAPDYPGYGFSSMPSVSEFDYSFDNVARLIGKFIDEIEVDKFSLYLMDYGAPVGFRIATARRDKVESLIIQNGNAYNEGIENNFWEPIMAYWKDRDAVNQGLDNDFWKNVKAAYKQPAMSNVGTRSAATGSRRQSGHSITDVLQLRNEPATVSCLAGILPQQSATDFDRLGKK